MYRCVIPYLFLLLPPAVTNVINSCNDESVCVQNWPSIPSFFSMPVTANLKLFCFLFFFTNPCPFMVQTDYGMIHKEFQWGSA